MAGTSEPPLVPPVPPDLLFLHPPAVSVVSTVFSSQAIKDSIMTEASPVANEIASLPVVSGASPTLVVPLSSSSAPEDALVENLSEKPGSPSSRSGEVLPKGCPTQGSEFNWLSRSKAARQFPKSSIPVTPSFSIDPPSLQRAPIWATLDKVPFDLLTDEGLEIISKPLGKIVDAKSFSSVSSVDVTYPWLPPLCPVCNEIGHKANFCPTRKSQSLDHDKVGDKKFSKSRKDYWKAKDKTKEHVSGTQHSKEPPIHEQTVPVKTCMRSVLADLDHSSGTAIVAGDPEPSSFVSHPVDNLPSSPPQPIAREVALVSTLAISSLENTQAVDETVHSLVPTVLSSQPAPVLETTQSEAPFMPTVNAVPINSVVDGNQEKFAVVSANPFAILDQEDDPPSALKDDENLSLVVSSPVNKQSYSPPTIFKTQKNKKRKLARRRICFGALLETRVSEANSMFILSVLGPEWKLIANYQYSDLGKIWFSYKDPIKVQLLFADSQSVTVKVSPPESFPFYYTVVYASNGLEDRRQLWISLRDTAVAFDLSSHPWMVCDFNEILDPRESSNTTNITSTRAMREFASCLSDIGLFDLASQGPHFTWSNHRPSDPIGKKIDRCLVNDRSQLSYPKGFCSFEPPEFSDHTPCHIRLTSTRPEFGSRAFMFPSYLANLPSFVPTIKDCWIQLGAHAKNLTSLCYKLKQLKSPIKTLCKKNFSQIERRVQEAKVVLDSHQIQALNLPSEDNIALEN
ncbi:hypothetical protein Bca4012_002091 [Brassica carinata]